MMDMFGAYTVGSFELRLLTLNVHVSPSEQENIDNSCLSCFSKYADQWLRIDHGFHTCSKYEDDRVQVFSCNLSIYLGFQ